MMQHKEAEDKKKRAAIYLYTNKSYKRPTVYIKRLQLLRKYAEFKGYDVIDIYCDKDLQYYNHPEYDRMMDRLHKYDVIVSYDWHHINKNTSTCISIFNDLLDKGVIIDTIKNGVYLPSMYTPLREPLTAAVYLWEKDYPTVKASDKASLDKDIIEYFIKGKTSWILSGIYTDICQKQTDTELVSLRRLMADKDKYDIIVVGSFNGLHWRTANFCHIRDALAKDIYSLSEGYLTYAKDNGFQSYLESNEPVAPDNRERGHIAQMRRLEKKNLTAKDVVYGYDWNKSTGTISVNASEAATVKYIFEAYAIQDKTPSEIHDELLSKGISRGKRTIVSTIQDTRYIGKFYIGKVTYKYDAESGRSTLVNIPRDEWVEINRPELRIIDNELWEKAQSVRKSRRKRRSK